MENIKFYLETDFPVASESLDYLYPEGAIHDNSKSNRFNRKFDRFKGTVLDLGCAGGGFVKDCIDLGRVAVGLEGTDFNKREKKFEWATIPDNLFTCDLTKPFILHTGNKKPFQFNIVTAWEFMEHIERRDLPQLFTNIRNHLIGGGLFIGTIDGNDYSLKQNRKVNLHRTVETREWWIETFKREGFVEEISIEDHFNSKNSWLRYSRSPNNYRFVFKKLDYTFKTPLCELGFKYGTDKCPQIKHRYTEVYYELFKDTKDKVKKVLEIGVGNKENMGIFGNPQYTVGASLKMWKEFFPNAQIYGIDTNPNCIFKEDRITTFLYDQTNYKDLEELIKQIGSDIDIVIDDGSHMPSHQIITFLELMPLLNKNVTYIIEDVGDLDIIKAFRKYDCYYKRFKDKQFWDERIIIIRNKNG